MSQMCLVLLAGLLLLRADQAWAEPSRPPIRIDHIMLGIANLDRGMEAFEQATGVRPVYGGKHPTGTHNALVSLGDGIYLDLIAAQPGAQPTSFNNDLLKLDAPTPIGWAVSADDAKALRQKLTSAGFGLSDLKDGSRVTPSGATLRWQTFELASNLPGDPFFIVWAAESPHPSSTSPKGCTLDRFTIANPDHEQLDRIRGVLDLPVVVMKAAREEFTLSLTCPKGKVVFGPAAKQP